MMKKRFWAMLLAVCMVISVLPTTALAAEGAVADPLQPDDVYYKFDGTKTDEDNAEITLSKKAVPVMDDAGNPIPGKYEVTLSATAAEVIQPKPTEVVFVLDASGSMRWCTLKHDFEGGSCPDNCPYTDGNFHDMDARWDIATEAIETMSASLSDQGATIKYVAFNNEYAAAEVASYREDVLKKAGLQLGQQTQTYLMGGVDTGIGCFSTDADTNKVLIVVADGGSSDNRYNSEKLKAFRDNPNNTVYTVGFTYSSEQFKGMATSAEHYYDAADARELNVALGKITEKIVGLINDPMGDMVDLDETVAVAVTGAGENAAMTTDAKLITWTDGDGLQGTVTLTYQVEINEAFKTAGTKTIKLNGNATLNYSYDNANRSVAFPVPQVKIAAATLDVTYMLDGSEVEELAEHEWIVLPDTFDTTIPEVGAEVEIDGETCYVTSVEGGALPTDAKDVEPKAYSATVNLSSEPIKSPEPILSMTKTVDQVGDKAMIDAEGNIVIPEAEAGDTIVWYIEISNSGDAAAEVAAPEDILTIGSKEIELEVVREGTEGALQPATYTVNPKSSIRFKAEYAVSINDYGKILKNVATLDELKAESPEVTVTDGEAVIDVKKWVELVNGEVPEYDESGKIVVEAGDTITWKIAVHNNGTADTKIETPKDTLTIGDKEIELTVKPLSGEAQTEYELKKMSTLLFTAEYTVSFLDYGKDIKNVASVNDEKGTDESVKVIDGESDVVINKWVNEIGSKEIEYDEDGAIITMAEVGDKIVWRIEVLNNGTASAEISELTDTMMMGTDEVTLVVKNLIGEIAVGSYTVKPMSALLFEVEYTVAEADQGKQIVNIASTKADGEMIGDEAPGVIVEKKAFSVDKDLIAVNGKTPGKDVEENDILTYRITVKNTGNVVLNSIVLKDSLGKSIYDVDGATNNDGTLTIDNLPVGDERIITYKYKVDEDDVKNDKIINVVTAEDEEVAKNEVEYDDYEPISPVGPPKLNYEDHYAYIVGYPDGLVHPEKNITRAEVATIFFRMLLDESREYFWAQENDFSDVVATDWFNNAVSTLANAELVTGYPDGSYRPNSNITRAEFATIAIRFFLDEDVEIEENNLSDVKDHWAEANINLAYALGLIEGYPDDTFRPDQLITRAEAMTIVNRVLKRAPHEDHLLEDMIEWPDNMDEDMWYYADVQEATNSHEFHMYEDKKENEEYEIWTELLPVRDWAALEREWSEANSSKNPGEVVDINIDTPEAGDEVKNEGSLTLN